jgi:hypothetical protein
VNFELEDCSALFKPSEAANEAKKQQQLHVKS